MASSNLITALLFSAFVKCPTKAHLLANGEPAPDSFFTDIERRISSTYKMAAKRQVSLGFEIAEFVELATLRRSLDDGALPLHVDCETAVYDPAQPPRASGRATRRESSLSLRTCIPTLFIPWSKASLSDSLLLCFGALALSQTTGFLVETGILIYGDFHRNRKVRIGDQFEQVRQIVNRIETNCFSQKEPQLVLNRHCSVCDFQPRCHRIAIERDDLSLLTPMTSKERAKCNAKGISTITQLSYGYRPRRRKRKRPDAEDSAKSAKRAAPVLKNDNKLRALAIKKKQIHVVGAPSVKFAGVPIFLDVEAMPERDFYYLVGLRFESDGEPVERSFWADGLDGERVIWEQCLRTLKAIGKVQIVSYGAFEIRYLKQMKERYTPASDDVGFVDHLIDTVVNLVGCIYGKIYFPTFSNSLKQVGRFLGFEWDWPRASGAATPLLRRVWELTADNEVKRKLIAYNMDDCRAASIVTRALVRICAGGSGGLDAVNIASLEVDFQYSWGRIKFSLPEFEKINNAAYWDYQRDKIYIRSRSSLRRIAKRQRRMRRRSFAVNTKIGPLRPRNCPACNSKRVWINGRDRRIVFDIRFSEGGVRRRVIEYTVDWYKCKDCGELFISNNNNLEKSPYGINLVAYIIYNIIEIHIPQYKLPGVIQKLFGYTLAQSTINRIIQRVAHKYLNTYEEIRHRLSHGELIHADETGVSVKGNKSYVWVFTSMEDVIYIWSDTRDDSTPTEFFKEFKGVLVSDFYAIYDSVKCPQQKCLIHLMRDLNEYIHQEPFNFEVKSVVHEFAVLLKSIIDTIDRFGLRSRFLKKHKVAVARFYNDLLCRNYNSELAQKIQERFKKNRETLFTFLEYNNVPWNNNNAEHAVKSFSRLRDVIEGVTNKRGIRDYLILVSIYETCKYREIDFLEFLRSGETVIDGYAGQR